MESAVVPINAGRACVIGFVCLFARVLTGTLLWLFVAISADVSFLSFLWGGFFWFLAGLAVFYLSISRRRPWCCGWINTAFQDIIPNLRLGTKSPRWRLSTMGKVGKCWGSRCAIRWDFGTGKPRGSGWRPSQTGARGYHVLIPEKLMKDAQVDVLAKQAQALQLSAVGA